jgi:hypothetical protein
MAVFLKNFVKFCNFLEVYFMISEHSNPPVSHLSSPQKVRKSSGRDGRRFNAVKHGFFSKDLLLPTENRKHLALLRKNLMAFWQPVGEMEFILFDEIVAASWRLKRLLRAETHYIPATRGTPDRPTRIPKADYRFSSWLNHNRYEVSLNRQLYRAMDELGKLQKARREAEAAARQDEPGG